MFHFLNGIFNVDVDAHKTNIKTANAIQERKIDEIISCQSNRIFPLAIYDLPHDSLLQI